MVSLLAEYRPASEGVWLLMETVFGVSAGTLSHRQAGAAVRSCILSPARTRYCLDCPPAWLPKGARRRAFAGRPQSAMPVSASAGNGAAGGGSHRTQREHDQCLRLAPFASWRAYDS